MGTAFADERPQGKIFRPSSAKKVIEGKWSVMKAPTSSKNEPW